MQNNKRDSKGGFNSGEHGSVKVLHHSIASTVRIEIKYQDEVEQGVVKDAVREEWLSYLEVKDLFLALKKASKGNLEWLLKDEDSN